MRFEKRFMILILAFFLFASFVSSLDLTINTAPVANTIVNDGDKPAVFDVTITNNGASGNFEIYTFEKFDVAPNNFSLDGGKTTTIRLNFFPGEPMKENVGYISTPFYIREVGGSSSQKKDIFIKLINFDDSFEVKGGDIDFESTIVKVSFYNVEDLSYDNVGVVFSSEFFDDREATFKFEPYEKEDINIAVDKEKLKKLVFGTYTITATFVVDGRTGVVRGPVKILEKAGLGMTETDKGIIIRKHIIEKTNEGNVLTIAEVSVRKNAISRLFSTFSPEPNNVERNGFFIDYFWQKELKPDEALTVDVTTNWLFPVVLVALIAAIVFIFNKFYTTDLIIKKSIGFVRTKDDRFALRVHLRVRARRFMEKVVIFDRLPGMTGLYEHYGSHPSQYDKNTGRIKWDVGKLTEGEERIFSYIIHSKLKVVGKFELPSATGIYEVQGQVHESKSNRVFFINEPKEKTED